MRPDNSPRRKNTLSGNRSAWMTPAGRPDRRAVARPDGQRAGDAALRQMFHERQEEWQVGLRDALLVERQDEVAGLRVQQEIGVLHPFRDPLEGEERAK